MKMNSTPQFQFSEIPQKRVLEFLRQNRLLSLATIDEVGRPWSATIFFAYDDDLSLLFYSDPQTRHCQNIRAHSSVSLTISHYWGKPNEIQGIQYVGEAEYLQAEKEQQAYQQYLHRYAWAAEYRKDHVMFRITPTEIWMIDSELTGDVDRRQIL